MKLLEGEDCFAEEFFETLAAVVGKSCEPSNTNLLSIENAINNSLIAVLKKYLDVFTAAFAKSEIKSENLDDDQMDLCLLRSRQIKLIKNIGQIICNITLLSKSSEVLFDRQSSLVLLHSLVFKGNFIQLVLSCFRFVDYQLMTTNLQTIHALLMPGRVDDLVQPELK
jgi:hypothetical protein